MATKSIGELTQDEFLRILGPEHGSRKDGSIVSLGQEGDPHICVKIESGKLDVSGPDEFRHTVMDAFERHNKIIETRKSIYYQNKKISALFRLRKQYVDCYLTLTFNESEVEHDEDLQNTCQILHDGLLNAISSIIDYYNIFFMLKLGIPFKRLNDVQHKKINNHEIRECNKNIKAKSNHEFFLNLYKYIRKDEQLKYIIDRKNKDPWDCIQFLHGGAILNHLKSLDVIDGKQELYFIADNKLVYCEKVLECLNYLHNFICTNSITLGAQYNIYLDLNNFLKHNNVPFAEPHLEIFKENERRAYAYFEIKTTQYCYLKKGIIKYFAEVDFSRLRDCLNEKIKNNEVTSIEKELGLPQLIKVDKENGFTSHDGSMLYFQIGKVMLARTKDSILIDSMSSLESTYIDLWRDIQRCLSPQT
ncbi:TPA: hypothetical protein P2Q90_004021 [Aeromonas veronii]|nr:hypothetical protein [Aeromonas veronii]